MDGRRDRRGVFGGRSCRVASDFDTKKAGEELAKVLHPGDVVCLEGDLGAGKTTFVKGLSTFFGIQEEIVISPTFVYLNQYGPIAHFDLYRLRDEEQFFSMGFEEYFAPPFIACVEWPNILKKALPEEYYWVSLKHIPEGREIVIEKRVSCPSC